MRNIIILLIFVLSFISCNEKESNSDTYSYTFVDNSKLIISTIEETYMKYGSIDDGKNLVFEYRFDAYDEIQIADDEYAETIQFEIDSNLQSFSYSNEELLNTNLVFTKHCFCYFPNDESKDVDPVGVITGEKLSNSEWRISINVTFYGGQQRSISGNFKLK